MTEARYKAGFDDVLDSLISTAVDFYKDDMANPLRTRAYYYNGIINWNSKRLVDKVKRQICERGFISKYE